MERLRLGLEEVVWDASLVAPSCIESDLLRFTDRLIENRMLTQKEGRTMMRFFAQTPVRVVDVNPVQILEWSEKHSLGVRTTAYLTAAVAMRAAILTFDPGLVAASRRAFIPRYVHTLRLQPRTAPGIVHSGERIV